MTFEAVLSSVIRGAALRHTPMTLDADALYLLQWRSASSHPMDLDRGVMLGEHVYTGAIVRLMATDEAMVRHLYGETWNSAAFR